jgi:hypothetical protein
VESEPVESIAAARRFASMQAHPHTHQRAIRPVVRVDDSLAFDCRPHRVAGTGEGCEQPVSLRLKFLTMVVRECRTEELPVLGEDLGGSTVAKGLE